jgi:hypothetical protein
MALFEISQQENSEMVLWLRSVRQELKSNTHIKSSLYDFDFLQGAPSGKSKRYDWDVDSEFFYEEREFSTQPSITRLTGDLFGILSTPESLVNIPTLDMEDVLL